MLTYNVVRDNINEGDFQLYFGNSFLRLTGPNEKLKKGVWAFFAGNGHFLLNTAEKGAEDRIVLSLKDLGNYQIEVQFPLGFFNTEKSVVLGGRLGTRQYSKGLVVGQNYSLEKVERLLMNLVKRGEVPDALKKWCLSAPKVTPSFLMEICGPQLYTPVNEAYASIKSRRAFSRALSSEFALVPHLEKNDFLIFYHHFPVAELVSKTKVKLFDPLFHDSLSDLLSPQGISILPEKDVSSNVPV